MFQRSSFHFHKFIDQTSPYDFSQSTGFNNYNSTQKISNPIYNYNFVSNYSINIPNQSNSNTFREKNKISMNFNDDINNNNNNERILIPDYSKYDEKKPFPLKEILSIDFEKILKYGNLSIINKYLPDIIYKSLEIDNNPFFNSIISKSQKLLNYLFQLKNDISNSNNNLENFITLPNSDLNNRSNELNNIKLNNKNIINENEHKRRELQIKMNLYKNVILTSGNGNLIPQQNLPLDIHDQNGIFYCDICPDKKFKSYEKVHEHYVKKHLNLDKLRGGGNLFLNYENNYFENKLNIIKDELCSTIKELNKQKQSSNENRKNEIDERLNKIRDLYQSTNLRANKNNITQSQNIQINKYFNNTVNPQQSIIFNNDEVNKQLDKLSQDQQNKFVNFYNQFEDFKNDIFIQLSQIMQGQKISVQDISYRRGGNIYNITYENGKRKEKIINEIPKVRNLRNNYEIDYGENDVVKRGTDIMNNLKNKNTNKVFTESIKENNDTNYINNNNNRLRGVRRNIEEDTLENLRKRYEEREEKILFNNELTTIDSVLENYNFLNLEPSKKQNDELKKKIKEKIKMFKLEPENDENISKKDYEKVINNIFSKSIEDSSNPLYGKYKSNIYSINEIEKTIKDSHDIMEEVYNGLDLDEIYDYKNDEEDD